MYAVVTTVALKPGTADAVAALFRETNPALVQDQEDWQGARMLIDRESDTATVIALWRSAEAYRELAESAAFKETMGRFAPHFAGPPEVSVTEIVAEMTPETVRRE